MKLEITLLLLGAVSSALATPVTAGGCVLRGGSDECTTKAVEDLVSGALRPSLLFSKLPGRTSALDRPSLLHSSLPGRRPFFLPQVKSNEGQDEAAQGSKPGSDRPKRPHPVRPTPKPLGTKGKDGDAEGSQPDIKDTKSPYDEDEGFKSSKPVLKKHPRPAHSTTSIGLPFQTFDTTSQDGDVEGSNLGRGKPNRFDIIPPKSKPLGTKGQNEDANRSKLASPMPKPLPPVGPTPTPRPKSDKKGQDEDTKGSKASSDNPKPLSHIRPTKSASRVQTATPSVTPQPRKGNEAQAQDAKPAYRDRPVMSNWPNIRLNRTKGQDEDSKRTKAPKVELSDKKPKDQAKNTQNPKDSKVQDKSAKSPKVEKAQDKNTKAPEVAKVTEKSAEEKKKELQDLITASQDEITKLQDEIKIQDKVIKLENDIARLQGKETSSSLDDFTPPLYRTRPTDPDYRDFTWGMRNFEHRVKGLLDTKNSRVKSHQMVRPKFAAKEKNGPKSR